MTGGEKETRDNTKGMEKEKEDVVHGPRRRWPEAESYVKAHLCVDLSFRWSRRGQNPSVLRRRQKANRRQNRTRFDYCSIRTFPFSAHLAGRARASMLETRSPQKSLFSMYHVPGQAGRLASSFQIATSLPAKLGVCVLFLFRPFVCRGADIARGRRAILKQALGDKHHDRLDPAIGS